MIGTQDFWGRLFGSFLTFWAPFPWRPTFSSKNPHHLKKRQNGQNRDLQGVICWRGGPPVENFFRQNFPSDQMSFQKKGAFINLLPGKISKIFENYVRVSWFKITTLKSPLFQYISSKGMFPTKWGSILKVLRFEKEISAQQAMLWIQGLRGASLGSFQTFWSPFPWRSTIFL